MTVYRFRFILIFLLFLNSENLLSQKFQEYPYIPYDQLKNLEKEFLDTVQYYAFKYFLHEINQDNSLVRDRLTNDSPITIAACGFALPINNSKRKSKGRLYLSVLPLQVNPYYQFLNNPGGVSEVRTILANKGGLSIDGIELKSLPSPSKSLSFNFYKNDALSALKDKNFLGLKTVNDETNLASALMIFNFDFSKRDTITVSLIYDYYSSLTIPKGNKLLFEYFQNEENKVKNFWRSHLDRTQINGSDEINKLFDIVRSNLAYILINKDYSGIQPGSRSYERSWIRDGSLTSTALLRFGFNYEVKDFIRWYGKHIYENGKVPCVVDRRGPDPVDEHDSHGEFIYLLSTYFKY